MKKYQSILIAVLMATSVASTLAQGTVVFNNGTGLVQQAIFLPGSVAILNVAKGGGEVQLFWAATGSPFTPLTPSLTPAAWYAANPGWSLGPVVGFTTPAPGKFSGGALTLAPLTPGGAIDYVVIGWTGNYQSFDAALAVNTYTGVSGKFTSATGNPTTVPSGVPVPLASSFGGLILTQTPEPSSFALAGLGAATLFALHRRE
jgi:hypothetical protein